MPRPYLNLVRIVLVAATFIVGILAIAGSYRYESGTSGGEDEQLLTCSGQEPSENATYFPTHASYPNGCYLSTYYVLADSQEEANQCIIDQGYLAEAASEINGCDFFFRVRQGVACSVNHVEATNESNATSCANYRYSGTIDNVTSAVSSGSCQRTVNMSSVNAQCPQP